MNTKKIARRCCCGWYVESDEDCDNPRCGTDELMAKSLETKEIT